MTARLTPGQSRAAALLLLLLCLGAAYVLLVAPTLAVYRTQAEEIDDLSHRLGHYQRLAGNRAALEQSLQQLKRSGPASGFYLQDRTTALAAAELQARVKGLIEHAGGGLVSTQPLVGTGVEAGREVQIRVRMRGGMDALREVLHALEYGTPLLLLDNVSIVKARRVRRRAASDSQGPLQVNFDLTGFVQGGAS